MARQQGQLSPAGQRIVLTIVCLIFITVGLSLWIPGFVLPLLEWSKHRKWKPVPCTVVKTPFEDAGAALTFRYSVDGTDFESTSSEGEGFFSSSAPLGWRLRRGQETTCYVNPYLPREAVLQRDFDPEIFVWCAPLLFVLLPLLALGSLLVRWLFPPAPEPEAPKGSLVLKPRSNRGCGVLLLVVFILTFGAPIAILVLLPGFQESLGMRLVYIVPLSLVVLLLLKTLLRTILRSLNPTLALTVTPGQVSPGRDVDVRWESRGSPGGIKRFRILLEGREEVYSGKTLKSSPFAAIDVFQGGTKDFKRGQVRVSLPRDAMPSLAHGGRRITWVLQLTAEVSGLPNLFEEYPVTVGTEGGA